MKGFSDLAQLFGTFHNPKSYEHETGFCDGASERVGEMLRFKDVSEPKSPKGDIAQKVVA